LACKQWHEEEIVAVNWRWVTTLEKGEFPNVTVNFLALTCCHCIYPACMQACPADAIYKRKEDGIVLIDQEKCFGKDICGGACRDACPYTAPQFNQEENARMSKCDFCSDRISEGKGPICVDACPCRALDWGPLDELKKRYDGVGEADGFVSRPEVGPSIIFKRKASSSK
jgi:anaerobic dimethyl sulfoxide reductase subunit B (iron-sulfur subunit)